MNHTFTEQMGGSTRRGHGLGFLCGALAAGLLFFFSWGGAASWAEGEKDVLGLPELIKRAISMSPELAQKRSETAAARSDLAQAESAYFPQFDGKTIVGPVNDARRPEIIGSRITNPSPYLAVGGFGNLDLTVIQPLYTFGKLSNNREAAERGVAASRAKQAQTKNEIALRVKELYYALVMSRSGIEAASEAGTYFDEARSRMSRLLQLGSPNVIESDLYRVDAYRAGIVRFKAEAEKGANVAYFALKAMTGMAQDADFETADESLPFKDRELGKEEEYIEKALAQRPELKQLEEGLAARSALVEAARSDLYPSFFTAVAGSFAGAPGRQTLNNPYIPDEFNHAYGGVVGGVEWHFDFGIGRARVEKAQAEHDALLHTRALAYQSMPIQVAKDYEDARQWRVAVNAYREAASASRKWIVSSMSSFDMGTGTADDLLRGIERYGENHGKYLEALFNYNLSLAQLDYDTGASQ